MGPNTDSIKPIKSILVSRNSPIALVVGAAGFLGSFLCEGLCQKGIQVIGIDNLSSSSIDNLESLSRNDLFHFLNQNINSLDDLDSIKSLNLPRLDYAFFVASNPEGKQTYTEGLSAFLKIALHYRSVRSDKGTKSLTERESEKPKIALVSSVELYSKDLSRSDKRLKNMEIEFSKYVSSHKLNGRIIRLGAVYGPRMNFFFSDPIVHLLHSALTDNLQEENTSLTFSSRAIYVEDAVDLILKSVLNGSTASKIYDGLLLHPLKVSELRQVLLDPDWHLQNGYDLTKLPPWPTPNLEKTIDELNWQAKANLYTTLKQTLHFFKQHPHRLGDLADQEKFVKSTPGFPMNTLSSEAKALLAEERAAYQDKYAEEDELIEEEEEKLPELEDAHKGRSWKKRGLSIVFIAIIFAGLALPFFEVGIGTLLLRQHLQNAGKSLEQGQFDQALVETKQAKQTVSDIKQGISWLAIINKLNIFSDQIKQADQIVGIAQQGVNGADQAIQGAKVLYNSTKLISGEDRSNPMDTYTLADAYLKNSQDNLAEVRLKLSDPALLNGLPSFLSNRLSDLSSKLTFYSDVVEKADAAAKLLPSVTGVGSKKSYLVLLQNNLELRPTGGFIGSYAKLDFEDGRIKGIKVDDIYNLDGALKEQITPPSELKSDLGQNYWYLRDSNWEPDFPTAARQAEFFYNKEASDRVNGVIAIDLSATSALLNGVGGLNLPEYSEMVTPSNLFAQSITHAETGFFPGSQAKHNYLTSMQTQLFNKIFFLSNQNWPAIIDALSQSLEQKHLMVYLGDPLLFSYVTSQNWGGVMPRPTEDVAGQTNDFISPVEANMGANKVNYYLDRNYKLSTSIGKDGEVNHDLVINYKNNSPSAVFPGGNYKNRLRLYLPIGAKLSKASYGDIDITSQVSSYNDYGRAVFSMFLLLSPKDSKTLKVSYQLARPLNFKDAKVDYRLDVIKQAGTERDPFEWQLTYPINYRVTTKSSDSTASSQELDISTNLSTDRSFSVSFAK